MKKMILLSFVVAAAALFVMAAPKSTKACYNNGCYSTYPNQYVGYANNYYGYGNNFDGYGYGNAYGYQAYAPNVCSGNYYYSSSYPYYNSPSYYQYSSYNNRHQYNSWNQYDGYSGYSSY